MQVRKDKPLSGNGSSMTEPVQRPHSGASTVSRGSSIADSPAVAEPIFGPVHIRAQHQHQHLQSVQRYEDTPEASELAKQLVEATASELQRLESHDTTTADNHHLMQLSTDVHQPQMQHNSNTPGVDDFAGTVPSQMHQSFGNVGLVNQDTNMPDQQTRTNTPQVPGTDGEKKERKSLNASAANEKELRELLETNEYKSLDAIARDVRNAERTQKSERAKQLFAMRWLREFCKHDKESVPRNRVYTHYAQRCGTDRVDTLNPASFGKLVRIIFPGIQTRRLGVRGESKYHYVNLSLRDDPQANLARPQSARNSTVFGGDRGFSFEPEGELHHTSRFPADTATFNNDTSFDQSSQIPNSNPASQGLLFADPLIPGFRREGEAPQMYPQSIRFSSAPDETSPEGPMTLPSIYQYISPKTDADLAEALTALYRTHCTSLIDAVRYVKEKSFFRLLASFNGTMTVPVSRLFSQHSVAAWIRTCDWLMYQQIVRFVSKLAHQVLPPQVFTMLGNVSSMLTDHIRRNFAHFPHHVLQAKLEPATIFAGLLQRLLRVNETTHAAANLLNSDPVRNLMWQDWVRAVRPKRVIESELPNCGYEDVFNILTTEVRQLLEPLEPADWCEIATEFQNSAVHSTVNGEASPHTTDTIVDRWITFLKSLPGRFPHAYTRTLLHAISTVGTAALRDITVSQAQSFGSWWITKVWVDEMMLWLAEMGGFLDARPQTAPASPQHSEGLEQYMDQSHHTSPERSLTDPNRSGGLGINFQQMPNLEPTTGRTQTMGPPTGTFKFSKSATKFGGLDFDIHDDAHDDSGIGMSLLGNPLVDNEHHGFVEVPDIVNNDLLVR